ncbi:hypothetical protein [Streptomyces sp. NRRL S-1314]|uniref:hypothetical protein n=1 Tax=Streptomyces sp. NRRL S-1314 TaxID=1463882 RepID=UPI00131DC922|nr:hypothetical protein [Streptomyces sp. NRRL S-1314]
MEITAKEFRATALPQPLRFPPPYADRTANPDGYSYWWQLFRLVFDLPDPRNFPALDSFSADELTVIKRYIRCCEELAESTVLSSDSSIKLHVTRADDGTQTENFTANFPPREAIRGTTVLFRQLYSNAERASYTKVRQIIGRHIHGTQDADRDRRDEMQRRWNRTHGQLRAYLLTYMADRVVCEARGWHTGMIPNAEVKPEELTKLFLYGDLIHWGDGAEELDQLSSDEVTHAWNTLRYMQVVAQLSHFYLGYSLLAKAAIKHSI